MLLSFEERNSWSDLEIVVSGFRFLLLNLISRHLVTSPQENAEKYETSCYGLRKLHMGNIPNNSCFIFVNLKESQKLR